MVRRDLIGRYVQAKNAEGQFGVGKVFPLFLEGQSIVSGRLLAAQLSTGNIQQDWWKYPVGYGRDLVRQK